MEEKFHWYMFVFHEGNREQSTFQGFVYNKISRRIIEENKNFCDLGENSMCANICYLGYMTAEEFNG